MSLKKGGIIPLLLIPLACLFGETEPMENDSLRRIYSALLIGDSATAVYEAESALKRTNGDKDLRVALGKALASAGDEKKALKVYRQLTEEFEDNFDKPGLLEEICWGILHKSLKSPQYGIRVASLVGAYLTRDVRAVKVLQTMLQDSNAVLRAIALKLCRNYPDGPLLDEISSLVQREKMWPVRMELIQTIGALRLKKEIPYLESVLLSDHADFEERALAIQSLVHMFDRIELDQIRLLASSKRAPLRRLAAEAVAHFEVKEAKNLILPLIYDPRPDVRSSALHAASQVFIPGCDYAEMKSLIEHSLRDFDPTVAIMAGYAALLLDPAFGQKEIKKWLYDEKPENRWLAAGAVARSGSLGASLALETLRKSKDPYVRVNLALGLLGQRIEIKRCCNILFEFLIAEKKRCMWDERLPYFQILTPSRAVPNDDIPNFPEAVDQMTRLELFSFLAIMGDARALEALKDFLQKKTWGITGLAAATLLKEGEQESMEVVRELLKDPHPTIRMQAALVLAMFGKDEQVASILEEAYPAADHTQKLHILEALGHIARPESRAFFIRALDEPFEVLRVVAASSLIQCLNK